MENQTRKKVEEFFKGWDEVMITSCLQGYMGSIVVAEEEAPKSAMLVLGDFCFLAGEPSKDILKTVKPPKLLIPKDSLWEAVIERFFENRINKTTRYAIKKEPDVFDCAKLEGYVTALSQEYELRMFDEKVFELAKSEAWSVDLCSQFKDYEEYKELAIGTAILHNGVLVAGASPYAVYQGGIEIEIDTKPEYRQKGLATVCGAKLILECLKENRYPSWDAHDMRSVSLAEKLGYHLAHPYVTYELLE